MIFIYSFLDGETKWALDGPTDEDLVAVEDGQLEVLRTGGDATVETVNGQGEWSPVAEAEYLSTHGQEWHE